jgi:hypothetical protein
VFGHGSAALGFDPDIIGQQYDGQRRVLCGNDPADRGYGPGGRQYQKRGGGLRDHGNPRRIAGELYDGRAIELYGDGGAAFRGDANGIECDGQPVGGILLGL